MQRRLIMLAAAMLAPLVVAITFLPRDGGAAAVVAQGTGTVTGQVIWCTPLLVRVGVAGAETAVASEGVAAVAPEAQPDGTVRPPGPVPIPLPRPTPPRPIPAGAVLVAVQNTSLNARTDEGGSFRIEGLPVGQYFTVAAGPVRNAPTATGIRPNVIVTSAGETVNLGQIGLGGPCFFGPVPLGAPGAAEGQPGEAP